MKINSKKFIQLGTLALSAMVIAPAMSEPLVVSQDSDNGFFSKIEHMVQKTPFDISNGFETHVQSTAILPPNVVLSTLPAEQKAELLKKTKPLLMAEVAHAFNQGYYPNVQANKNMFNVTPVDETHGSDAQIGTAHWQNSKGEAIIKQDMPKTACVVVAGINNENGVPTLDFAKFEAQYDMHFDPDLVRQFTMLHELAHCEAAFIGNEGYNNPVLSAQENAAWNSYVSQEDGLPIEGYHLHDYFDETFADSYASVAFLRAHQFSDESVHFLEQIVELRTKIRTKYLSEGYDIFADPHDSAKSVAAIVDLAQHSEQFKSQVLNDKNGAVAYQSATQLASHHLDEMVSTDVFMQKMDKLNLAFDDTLQPVFNKISASMNHTELAQGNNQDNEAQLASTPSENTIVVKSRENVIKQIKIMQKAASYSNSSNLKMN